MVQMGVALQHLSHVINEVAPGAPLVFCGDFNSTPNSGNSTATGTTTLASVSANIHYIFHLMSEESRISEELIKHFQLKMYKLHRASADFQIHLYSPAVLHVRPVESVLS